MYDIHNRKFLSGIATALLALGLSACGGGSGDDNTVSGTAMAPSGTNFASLNQKSMLLAVSDFFMPAANAEITGLRPVSVATIQLVRLSNDGAVIEVLATAQTATDGSYSLKLPGDTNLASNLVLRITSADGTETLDAQVLSRNTDINPYSDYLLDKLLENRTQLDNLSVNEAVLLKGKLEQYDLSASNTMSEMLAALEAATGDFMDQSIATINNGAGDASSVAGRYHLGEFSLSLHDSDEEPFGTFSTELRLLEATLTDNGSGEVSATLENARIDTWYNLQYSNGGPHDLYVVNEVSNDFEVVEGLVDGSGALVFESSFEEDIEPCDANQDPAEDCFAWRFPPSTSRFTAIGSGNLFVGRFIDAGVRYHQTADGVLDPNRKDGDEVFYNLALLAKKGSNQNAASLDGNFGVVGLSATAEHESGNTLIEGFNTAVSFDGEGAMTGETFDGLTISRAHNSAPQSSADAVPVNGTYNITSEGKFSLTIEGEADNGFISSDGKLLALYSQDTTQTGTNPVTTMDALNGMSVGIKLPATLPTMAGSEYRLHGLMFGYGDMDTVLSSLDNAVLSFDTGPSVSIDAERIRGIERETDTRDLQAFAETLSTIASNSATILPNGQFSAELTVDGTALLSIDGYISDSKNLIIFRTTYSEGATQEAGLFIGSLIK